jgi:murein L,D-transpeptidase YafK
MRQFPSLLFLLVLLSLGFFPADSSFKSEQLRYRRVQDAYVEKETLVKKWLSDQGIRSFRIDLYIRAFKEENQLEIWVKERGQKQFVLLKQYAFCKTSGDLGPKRRQGDGQIPEGFYFIDRFNPVSNFYLSLGLNYPNAADQLREKAKPSIALGGDIFIHGDCVTIGCIPLTNDKIKEVYVLAVEARHAGQAQIPVHIFPSRLSTARMKMLHKGFTGQKDLLAFWENLKPGYDAFEHTHQLPKVAVSPQGTYHFTGLR